MHSVYEYTYRVSGVRLVWRFIGARSPAEAKGYYVSKMLIAWGMTAVRAFARHRLSRVPYIGYTREDLPARLV